MKHFSTVLIFLLAIHTISLGQVQFSEQSQELGCINSSYGTGTLGGGISFFDFDNDGWDDITVSSEEGLPVRFFKNNNGFFSEIDLGIEDELFETKTVQWVDFDNDGDYDFFVTAIVGYNRLYENNGNMEFTDITDAAGLILTNNLTFGGSWGDYNKDGLLDLFVTSRNLQNNYPNILYKNNGDGTFTNVTESAGLSLDNHLTFCSAFFDYNNDGWQDIYLANDRYDIPNLLYRNNGDDTFTEVALEAGANLSIDAMSTSIGDYNNDGWLDIYVTNTGLGNSFLKNNGDGTYTDVAIENGTLMESVAWGAVFLDAENDADLDLYVSSMITQSTTSLTSAFYENDGTGMFTIPEDAGFENDAAVSFSNAIGDIDNNGYPDIIVLNYTPDNIYLWKNISPETNNWIKIKLQGVESNRQGIGSWIEISVDGQKQYNYTLCGEGYLGQNSAYEFFGIADATAIDYIKVTWLSGIIDFIPNPVINEHLTIVEGSYILSAGEDILFSEIGIYPNPGGLFTIYLPQLIDTISLSIVDVSGRILMEKREIVTLENIEISHYSKGIYFFLFEKGTTKLMKKVIVN